MSDLRAWYKAYSRGKRYIMRQNRTSFIVNTSINILYNNIWNQVRDKAIMELYTNPNLWYSSPNFAKIVVFQQLKKQIENDTN